MSYLEVTQSRGNWETGRKLDTQSVIIVGAFRGHGVEGRKSGEVA